MQGSPLGSDEDELPPNCLFDPKFWSARSDPTMDANRQAFANRFGLNDPLRTTLLTLPNEHSVDDYSATYDALHATWAATMALCDRPLSADARKRQRVSRSHGERVTQDTLVRAAQSWQPAASPRWRRYSRDPRVQSMRQSFAGAHNVSTGW